MTLEAREILQKALALSDKERAEVAGKLIESLDLSVDADADAAWQEEVARRLEEVRLGKVKTVSRAKSSKKHVPCCMGGKAVRFYPEAEQE